MPAIMGSGDDKDVTQKPLDAATGCGGVGADDLASRVQALEAELASAREEKRQQHERWLRERADLENLKKRTARERADVVKFANEQLLKDLLPILDNLERAMGHALGGGNGQPLVEGVELILRALEEVLERHGVTPIRSAGAPFDPAHHQAMAHVESADHAPNSVIEEHQRGYRLNDRLLRPALVTVAKAPPPERNLAKDKGGD